MICHKEATIIPKFRLVTDQKYILNSITHFSLYFLDACVSQKSTNHAFGYSLTNAMSSY
jgi:hypothetical protein